MATSILFFLPTVYPVTVSNMNWTVVVVFGTLSIAALNWLFVARHTYSGPRRVDALSADLTVVAAPNDTPLPVMPGTAAAV